MASLPPLPPGTSPVITSSSNGSSSPSMTSVTTTTTSTNNNNNTGNQPNTLARQGRQFSRKIRLSTSVQFDTSTIIEGFLYLGAKGVTADREKLATMNIKYIIGVSEDPPPEYGKDMEYLHINIGDTPTDDISPYFGPSYDFIEQARLEGKGVLVHCTMGMSRSATLVLAYLIRHNDMSLADAISYMKARRPVASPNPGFMTQLIQFEQTLRGKATVDINRYVNNRFGEVHTYCIKDE
jgi:hypothetical protein